jgi:hypothetical protein
VDRQPPRLRQRQIDDTTPAATDYPANGTIFDELDAHGISWKDYFSTTPSTELFAQPLAAADPSALTCSVTGPGTIPPPGSVTG